MTVKAPAERNFRRARAKPSRRTWLQTLVSRVVLRRAVNVVLLGFGLYEATTFALTTPLLRVDHIAVHGNVRLSSGEVQALVEDLRGASIVSADLGAFRRRLIESPWVADVALRRVLPSTIEVFVSERRPVGFCRLGEELYLIDETGTVIDQFGPQYAEFDLPIIDGLVGPPPGPRGRRAQGAIDPERAALAARVLAGLGRSHDVGRRVSQIDVSDVHDAVVLLDGDAAMLHVGEDRFLERVQSYMDLSGALRERIAEIDYVDLRFEQRVYVRPADARNPAARGRRDRAPGTRQF
jgi:cell division septal protein FtsQ